LPTRRVCRTLVRSPDAIATLQLCKAAGRGF
jgi:hypothetical protein